MKLNGSADKNGQPLLNFLGGPDDAITFEKDAKPHDFSKVKINKQFPLINTVPKL